MTRSARLIVVLALNLVLVSGLLAVGLSAHSLAVLAEGADYLADAAAIGVSLFAIWLSKRPPSLKRPGGYPRATAFAALVNGGWLLILSFLVIIGGIDRLAIRTHEVHALPVLIVSAIAAAVMFSGAFILGTDSEITKINEKDNGDLNMRAVLLDTTADAAAAAGVALTGAIILWAGGLYWLDPTVAVAISAVIAYHALRLLVRVAGAFE